MECFLFYCRDYRNVLDPYMYCRVVILKDFISYKDSLNVSVLPSEDSLNVSVFPSEDSLNGSLFPIEESPNVSLFPSEKSLNDSVFLVRTV